MEKFTQGHAAPLTRKDVHHIYHSHMHMDPTADGKVTIDALKSTCEAYGMRQVDDLFLSADENGNGEVDFEEFSRIMRTRFDGGDNNKLETQSQDPVRVCLRHRLEVAQNGSAVITMENLREIFDAIDLNGDGVLQISELITVLGETPGLDVDAISAWADKSDLDLNGVIDFTEYCVAMLPKPKEEEKGQGGQENSCTSTSKAEQCMGQPAPSNSDSSTLLTRKVT